MVRLTCLLGLALGGPLPLLAQRQLVLPATRPPDTLSDSVQAVIHRLHGQGFTYILTFGRYHDTGTYNENFNTATVVWKIDGQVYAKVFRRGARGVAPVTSLPLDTLMAFYRAYRIADLPDRMVMRRDAPGAGPAYNIGVIVPGSASLFNVRAPARHAPHPFPPSGRSSGPEPLDPRGVWLDLLEQIVP